MLTDQPDRVRPFSCGTQYCDWLNANCDTCDRDSETCAVSLALSAACWDDGTVDADIAQRMGFTRYGTNHDHYNWPCLDHDPPFGNIEEWASGRA